MSFARQGAIWFPFSVFIAITAAYLPVHVAAGLTRRTPLARVRSSPPSARASSTGVVFDGLLLVERAVFGGAGLAVAGPRTTSP